MADRPLGIADVMRGISDRDPAVRSLAGYVPWYWCRRHKQPAKGDEPCTDPDVPDAPVAYLRARMVDCIRVGPFMSEREANLLSGVPEASAGPLGMEVET